MTIIYRLFQTVFINGVSSIIGTILVSIIVSAVNGVDPIAGVISGAFSIGLVGATIGIVAGLTAGLLNQIKAVAIILLYIFIGALLGAFLSDALNAAAYEEAIANFSPALAEIIEPYFNAVGSPGASIGAFFGGFISAVAVVIALVANRGRYFDRWGLFSFVFLPWASVIGGLIGGALASVCVRVTSAMFVDNRFIVMPVDLYGVETPAGGAVAGAVFGIIVYAVLFVSRICRVAVISIESPVKICALVSAVAVIPLIQFEDPTGRSSIAFGAISTLMFAGLYGAGVGIFIWNFDAFLAEIVLPGRFKAYTGWP